MRRLALPAAAPASAPLPARAQTFPERPVRSFVPCSAGGATDAAARVLAAPAMQSRRAELGVDRALALPPAESGEAYVAAERRAPADQPAR